MKNNNFKKTIDMKKYISNKRYWKAITFFGCMVFALVFTVACESNDSAAGPIVINKVYLEDVNSSVKDREVNFIRLQQTLRIEGSGFTNLKKVYVNGFSTYFNPTLLSDTSMLIKISKDTPILNANPAVRNTIRLVNDNNETIYTLSIRSAKPTIKSISNTLPFVGETITVFGTDLVEVSKVVFPGNIEVTTGIIEDTEGKFFKVTVPNGIPDEGGSIFVECSNGGVYSPAYFNFKKGIILNFDGVGVHGYWDTTSMTKPADLESTVTGLENISHGVYAPLRPSRVASFPANKNRNSEVWTSGSSPQDNWRTLLANYIPATTPLDQIGIQFDIYVPNPWQDSGFIKICLANAFNGGEWSKECYNYVPWIVDGKVVPFQTTGWTTVTVPLNKFYKYSKEAFTFQDVLAYREAASNKNFGFYFENSDINLKDVTGVASETVFLSKPTSVSVYIDNWRIVSLVTPVYNDFPDSSN